MNEVLERKKFNSRVQGEGETFDDFLTCLRDLSRSCNFCSSCNVSLIRDRIVIGLRSTETVHKLCAIPNLSLPAAISLCRCQEAAYRDATEIRGPDVSVARIYSPGSEAGDQDGSAPATCRVCGPRAVRGQQPPHLDPQGSASRPPRRPAEPATTESTCRNCGYVHRRANDCPARGRECRNCGKIGHFAAVCRSRQAERTYARHDQAEPQWPTTSAIIASTTAGGAPRILVDLQVGDRVTKVNALPDTGADLSVGGISLLEKLGLTKNSISQPSHHPQAANGVVLRSVGVLRAVITLGDARIDEEVHILRGVSGLLISWDATKRLRLVLADYPRQIAAERQSGSTDGGSAEVAPNTRAATGRPRGHAVHSLGAGAEGRPADLRRDQRRPAAARPDDTERGQQTTLPGQRLPQPSEYNASSQPSEHNASSHLVLEFERVFDGHIRTMPGEEFTIHLVQDSRPFCVTAPRRIPLSLREPLKAELERLETEGVIRRVAAPTEWCAPIVVAPKKGGAGVRLCVDLSQLNKYVRRELYQSPTPIEEVASIHASKAQWFTVFDALKGYHQCPLAEESQPLTTFITPFGRFAFLRAPYGITSIAEHYNRRMDEAFEGMTGFRKVVDDVIIFSRTREEHIQHVRKFLTRCQEKGISLNVSKLQLAQQTVKFAGFVVSGNGYRPDPDLITALSKFPTPGSLTEFRSFFSG